MLSLKEFIKRLGHTWNRPIMEEHPGPPLNHVARGAVVGLFRASKNQNHIFSLARGKN
jgi:hypothetical protein